MKNKKEIDTISVSLNNNKYINKFKEIRRKKNGGTGSLPTPPTITRGPVPNHGPSPTTKPHQIHPLPSPTTKQLIKE